MNGSDISSELLRMKSYFPFRIIWGVIVNDKLEAHADKTKRGINKALREGKLVYSLGKDK
jgi:hypothetical protein